MAASKKPYIMGALMGLMMLGMVHLMLTGEEMIAGWALAGFVALHILAVGLVAVLSIFAARLSPRLRSVFARIHRPTRAHVFQMLFGALVAAGGMHLLVHGVI